MLQVISILAQYLQAFLFTEDENKELNTNVKLFDWLVDRFGSALSAKSHRNSAVIELLQVRHFNVLFSHIFFYDGANQHNVLYTLNYLY